MTMVDSMNDSQYHKEKCVRLHKSIEVNDMHIHIWREHTPKAIATARLIRRKPDHEYASATSTDNAR